MEGERGLEMYMDFNRQLTMDEFSEKFYSIKHIFNDDSTSSRNLHLAIRTFLTGISGPIPEGTTLCFNDIINIDPIEFLKQDQVGMKTVERLIEYINKLRCIRTGDEKLIINNEQAERLTKMHFAEFPQVAKGIWGMYHSEWRRIFFKYIDKDDLVAHNEYLISERNGFYLTNIWVHGECFEVVLGFNSLRKD